MKIESKEDILTGARITVPAPVCVHSPTQAQDKTIAEEAARDRASA